MSDGVDPGGSVSVSWRLQRVTVEYAYVQVPVTSDLVREQPDGTGRLDVEKMIERAIRLGETPGVRWLPEEQRVTPHPIQKAPEPDER